MHKVVVTGASGFIGMALTKKLLAQDYHVFAVVRDKQKFNELICPNLSVIEADLDDYSCLSERIQECGFDAFFHLAWDGTFGDSFRNYHRQLCNAAHAADALMAAVALGCKRFILAGTIVQLEAKNYMLIDNCEPRISCIYGTAKAAAEMICKTLAYQNSIAYNTAILASVYGEGDQSNMIQNVLIRALLKGDSPKLVNGKNLYDWIYIDDVANGLIAIEQQGKGNKTYYVGHRSLQTFEDLVTQTRDIVAPNVDLCFGELQDKTEINYSLVDLDALFEDTGFQCQAQFKESIQRTAQWLLEQKRGCEYE